MCLYCNYKTLSDNDANTEPQYGDNKMLKENFWAPQSSNSLSLSLNIFSSINNFGWVSVTYQQESPMQYHLHS